MRLVFAGTPEFAGRALEALLAARHELVLVLTQPDRPAGRGLRDTAGAVKRLALERGLEVFQPASLSAHDVLARIAAARADFLVVAAYGLILPAAVLAAARLGALNIHASLLPRWRGAAPIQRAILAGDEETGITIMRMDEGLDTGPIIAQSRIPILPEDDGGTLHDKLALLGARMIVETLARASGGPLPGMPQPEHGATYARKLEKHEQDIDWRRTAADISRHVRALRPAPGATTRLRGAPLKIWSAEAVAFRSGTSGAVIAVEPDGLIVACGAGALRIRALQRAGGRRLGAMEFLRGFPVAVGERLG